MAYLGGARAIPDGATVMKVPEGTKVISGAKGGMFSTLHKTPETIHLRFPETDEHVQFAALVKKANEIESNPETSSSISDLASLRTSASQLLTKMTSERGINIAPIRSQFIAALGASGQPPVQQNSDPEAQKKSEKASTSKRRKAEAKAEPSQEKKKSKNAKSKKKPIKDSDTSSSESASDSDTSSDSAADYDKSSDSDYEVVEPKKKTKSRRRTKPTSQSSITKKVVKMLDDLSDESTDEEVVVKKPAKKYRAPKKEAKKMPSSSIKNVASSASDDSKSDDTPPVTSAKRRRAKTIRPTLDISSSSESSDLEDSESSDWTPPPRKKSKTMTKKYPSKTTRKAEQAIAATSRGKFTFCNLLLFLIGIALFAAAGFAVYRFSSALGQYWSEHKQIILQQTSSSASTTTPAVEVKETTPTLPPVVEKPLPSLFGSSMVLYGNNLTLLQVTSNSLPSISDALLAEKPMSQINIDYLEKSKIGSVHLIIDRNFGLELAASLGMPVLEIFWTAETVDGNESRQLFLNEDVKAASFDSITDQYLASLRVWCNLHGQPLAQCTANQNDSSVDVTQNVQMSADAGSLTCLKMLSEKPSWVNLHSKAAALQPTPQGYRLKLYAIHSLFASLDGCSRNDASIKSRVAIAQMTVDEQSQPFVYRPLSIFSNTLAR